MNGEASQHAPNSGSPEPHARDGKNDQDHHGGTDHGIAVFTREQVSVELYYEAHWIRARRPTSEDFPRIGLNEHALALVMTCSGVQGQRVISIARQLGMRESAGVQALFFRSHPFLQRYPLRAPLDCESRRVLNPVVAVHSKC